jgi:predicted choloylglycine hydrolase
VPQSLDFTAVDDGKPGSAAWAERVRAQWPTALAAVDESTRTPEGRAAAVAAFGEHLPELLPVLERLAEALDTPEAAAVLTQATLKPFFAACSQTSVAGALVRNYDFDPGLCERVISRTDYLRPVIGMSELCWGLLDGMNEAGLAVSLTFGGRLVHRPGMSILMIVRGLLETCDDVEQAWERLQRIPVATSQNLTLVDREQALSVHIGPDIRPARAASLCVTNHQTDPVDEEQELDTHTLLRHVTVSAAVEQAEGEDDDPAEYVVRSLLRPPVYNTDFASGFGTIYTAAYRPREGRVDYIWPGDVRWRQSFARFEPGARVIELGEG